MDGGVPTAGAVESNCVMGDLLSEDDIWSYLLGLWVLGVKAPSDGGVSGNLNLLLRTWIVLLYKSNIGICSRGSVCDNG
jgi:hypothetical protein